MGCPRGTAGASGGGNGTQHQQLEAQQSNFSGQSKKTVAQGQSRATICPPQSATSPQTAGTVALGLPVGSRGGLALLWPSWGCPHPFPAPVPPPPEPPSAPTRVARDQRDKKAIYLTKAGQGQHWTPRGGGGLGDQDTGCAALGPRALGPLLGGLPGVVLPHQANVVLLPELVQLPALGLQLLRQRLDDFADLGVKKVEGGWRVGAKKGQGEAAGRGAWSWEGSGGSQGGLRASQRVQRGAQGTSGVTWGLLEGPQGAQGVVGSQGVFQGGSKVGSEGPGRGSGGAL